MAEKGIGLWPTQTEMEPVPGTVKDGQFAMRNIGYCIPVNGDDDEIYRTILSAFQRHYRPKRVDGKADKETRTMLAAVQIAVQADMATSAVPED